MTAAIWPFDWITEFKDALPPTVISERQFPKVYAWIGRFRAAVKSARQSAPKPKTIQGSDALKHLISTGFAESEGKVDDNDPTGLRPGSTVAGAGCCGWMPVKSASRRRRKQKA